MDHRETRSLSGGNFPCIWPAYTHEQRVQLNALAEAAAATGASEDTYDIARRLIVAGMGEP